MKESIINVLDMYKEGNLSPEDAERLIDALWDGGENGPSVPWDNDNKLRVVAYRGRRLVKRGEAGDKLFTLKLEGDVNDLECWGSVECGTVLGNASSLASMKVGESVGGSASSAAGMEIGGDVGSRASAGGGMSVKGDVNGDVKSGGSFSAGGDITGDIQAGGNVAAGNIRGNVTANSVRCGSVFGAVQENGEERGSERRSRREKDQTGGPGFFDGKGSSQKPYTAGDIGGTDIGGVIRSAMGLAQDAILKAKADMHGEEAVTIETDGDLEIVAVQNGERIASSGTGELFLRLAGDIQNVTSSIAVTVEGDVEGNVMTGDRGMITCEDVEGIVSTGDGGQITCGSVEGNVSAGDGGQITCDSVAGDVSAGGQVICDSVEGDVSAGGQVTCDSVEGNVSSGGNAECGDVSGDVSAGGDVECGDVSGNVSSGGDAGCGDVSGDVHAEGSVNCGNVEGDVTCGGKLLSGEEGEIGD